MSDYTALLVAVSEMFREHDSGVGAPPRIPGHEADRLASLARGAESRDARPRKRRSTGAWRGVLARRSARAAAASPS
jgi:hypothetical protein